jgi:hypothetical protein
MNFLMLIFEKKMLIPRGGHEDWFLANSTIHVPGIGPGWFPFKTVQVQLLFCIL